MVKKKKLPRWFRMMRYYFNCLWYYVLFPLGIEQDAFTKLHDNKDTFKK